MNNSIRQLREITQVLLSPDLNYMAVRNSCTALYDFFCSMAGFDINDPETTKHISTATGLAVGPYSAAFCITDIMRTRNFLIGIKEAIDDRLKLKQGKPVIVMYAGTGPFATLLSPLITQYRPDELQLILLEINPLSINYLRRIIEKLDAGKYVKELIQADATLFVIPAQYQPDIIVSETMKPGLDKEPHVSLVSNLLVQCTKFPILIPECITVSACLLGNTVNDPDAICPLGDLVKFDADTALQIGHCIRNAATALDEVTLPVSQTLTDRCSQLALLTHIRVYKKTELRLNESSLTIPHKLANFSAANIPSTLTFIYELGESPGFRIK